ncbi:MAG: molybdenum cofactor biosynthesis protein MoaE, partial [Terriglobales bacterium]
MQVRVLFFGMLKDVVGRDADTLNLSDTALLADVLAHYEEEIPKLKHLLPSIALSLNREYADPGARLHSGDEIGLLPPVSGGLGKAFLVREVIDSEGVILSLKHPEDGAVVVFDGIVRNNTRGRRTLYLDYEAYEEMALKQMETLIEQARANFEIRDAAIVHRLGRLEIGETSVLIVVASAHRAAAFDACRWMIDTLKRTVPIWKKEYFEDGAVWADGEPFPAEV